MSKCFLVALDDEINYLRDIDGIPVFISGIGKLNAAIMTNKIINSGFDEIINIGSCGSKNHEVGKVLKISKFYQDIDITPIFEYGFESKTDSEISLDDNYSHSCFTTDYFYDENQNYKYSQNYLKKILTSDAFDMESFSIAKICRQNNIKFSCYKWVSDEGGYDSWKKNCKIGFEKFKDLYFKEII